jgi:hypothetical protein
MNDPRMSAQRLFWAVAESDSRRPPDPHLRPGPRFTGFDETGLLARRDREQKKDEGDRFYAGTGRQLASGLDAMLDGIFNVAEICKESGLWVSKRPARPTHLGRVVKGVLAEFFATLPDQPAILWSYDLCWTDGLVAVSQGRVVESVGNHQTDPFAFGESVPMRFLPSGVRKIVLPATLLNKEYWSPPAGVIPEEQWLLSKSWQAWNLLAKEDRRSVSAPYREQLGVMIDPTDQGLAACGIHPAQLDKSRSVWRDNNGLYGLSWQDAGSAPTPPNSQTSGSEDCDHHDPKDAVRFDPQSAELVKSIGILDVHLIKVKRYYYLTNNEDFVRYEGLCFALDRRDGTLIYISSSSDRLPAILEFDEEYNVLSTLER